MAWPKSLSIPQFRCRMRMDTKGIIAISSYKFQSPLLQSSWSWHSEFSKVIWSPLLISLPIILYGHSITGSLSKGIHGRIFIHKSPYPGQLFWGLWKTIIFGRYEGKKVRGEELQWR